MPALVNVPRQDWLYEVGSRNGVSIPQVNQPAQKFVANAGHWEATIQTLIDFQHLGDGWDGLGAKAPARDLLESAIGLAYLLYEKGVDPPHRVVPALDGSIVFEWQDPDGTYTEVEIIRPLHAEVMMIERDRPAKHWTLPTD
jgi:hypothetical protein